MRIAVLSDIHGNLTALKAVIADLGDVSPDLVIQAGDLVGSGGRLAEVIDTVIEAGWPSVLGNTDEMLWKPEKIEDFARRMPEREPIWRVVRDDIGIALDAITPSHLAWLRALPLEWIRDGVHVVHASPGDPWNAPGANAAEADVERVYGALGARIVAYGHLHIPFIRALPAFTLANSGSVGMPFDRDPRASYLLIDNADASIRRVPYDVEGELHIRNAAGYPHMERLARILRNGGE